jgi:hypothetical protein
MSNLLSRITEWIVELLIESAKLFLCTVVILGCISILLILACVIVVTLSLQHWLSFVLFLFVAFVWVTLSNRIIDYILWWKE